MKYPCYDNKYLSGDGDFGWKPVALAIVIILLIVGLSIGLGLIINILIGLI